MQSLDTCAGVQSLCRTCAECVCFCHHSHALCTHDSLTVKLVVALASIRCGGAVLLACRDGESHNLTWNCGEEGPTEEVRVQRLRARQQRNMAAALLLSQGVPMILMGDEYGHSKVRPCHLLEIQALFE